MWVCTRTLILHRPSEQLGFLSPPAKPPSNFGLLITWDATICEKNESLPRCGATPPARLRAVGAMRLSKPCRGEKASLRPVFPSTGLHSQPSLLPTLLSFPSPQAKPVEVSQRERDELAHKMQWAFSPGRRSKGLTLFAALALRGVQRRQGGEGGAGEGRGVKQRHL